MITISLCMIVRDEEETLGRVLDGVKDIVDEMIIADTGSVDGTKEIAASYDQCRIVDFEWIDDFAAARNFSFSQASMDYILWLDADDWLREEDRQGLLRLKNSLDPSYERVTMPYNLAYDSAGNAISSLRRNRLVRRDRGFKWIGPVHEYLEAWGKALDSDVCVSHGKEKEYSDRNLRIYRNRQRGGEDFSCRDLYYFANELKDHAFYDEAALYYEQMLRTGQGWIEDNIQACLKLADCYGHMGHKDLQLQAALRSLSYDKPRPESSCAIGDGLYEREQYEAAHYWYGLAVALDPPATMGMTNRTASTWYPHLQMCLCLDRLGRYKEAFEHNEQALAFHPDHPSMLHNREYFRSSHGLVSDAGVSALVEG